MATRMHRSGSGSMSVPRGAEYVGRLLLIKARKGKQSNWSGEYFQHKFTRSNEMYRVRMSVPRGSTKIYDRIESAKLNTGTYKFSSGKIYGIKDGRLLLVTNKGKYIVVGNQPLWDIFNYPE